MRLRRVVVIGLGLVGGSLGMRMRRLGLASVTGIDSDPGVARRAEERGAADMVTTDLSAIGDAELAIIAVPLDRIVPVATEAAEHARAGTVFTDTGSIKAPIVAALENLARVRYVGGHPMFGTEGRGIDAADPALPADRPYVVTPTRSTDPRALLLLDELIRDLGMRPVTVDPDAHDRLVAWVSHVPYLLARALIAAGEPEAHALAGPAFHDATRVARSPAPLWREILRHNRAHVIASLEVMIAHLGQAREALAGGEVDRLVDEG